MGFVIRHWLPLHACLSLMSSQGQPDDKSEQQFHYEVDQQQKREESFAHRRGSPTTCIGLRPPPSGANKHGRPLRRRSIPMRCWSSNLRRADTSRPKTRRYGELRFVRPTLGDVAHSRWLEGKSYLPLLLHGVNPSLMFFLVMFPVRSRRT